MIISKKKFERLVEEEVFKRLHEVEEKRMVAEQCDRLERYIGATEAQVDALRGDFEEFKRNMDICIKALRADIRYSQHK